MHSPTPSFLTSWIHQHRKKSAADGIQTVYEPITLRTIVQHPIDVATAFYDNNVSFNPRTVGGANAAPPRFSGITQWPDRTF